ncbi:S1 RNA-binding domain-containing protein [Brevibacillus halotolerans]|uniref:S1 RNA-binding domain-containing protein n=1 Tax=Brevibacillus halotolerans TaxID=1507437 RepID=UPI0015EF9043|nr:S1 RNA-binding domain-containing protein [Brevibacillus halotolerans]MBA4533819.1 30S ribosomal protein S1 [Brevibacillus halotolerans]
MVDQNKMENLEMEDIFEQEEVVNENYQSEEMADYEDVNIDEMVKSQFTDLPEEDILLAAETDEIEDEISSVENDEGPKYKVLKTLIEGLDPEKVNEMKAKQSQHSRVDENWKAIYRAVQNRQIIEAEMIGVEPKYKKLCAVVGIGTIRGYIPFEYTGFASKEQMNSFIGKRIGFKVKEIDRENNIFVASRIDALEVRATLTWQRIEEGQTAIAVVRGYIRDPKLPANISPARALRVDLGGVMVTILAVDVDHGWIDDLSEKYQLGDPLEVKIMAVDKERKKIKISAKALKPSPYPECTKRFEQMGVYIGKVTGVVEYGVFVSLEPGVDVLCKHMPFTELQKGDRVTVRLLNINVAKQQMKGNLVRKL